jgi:hypothetical protein
MSDLLARERALLTGLDAAQQAELAGLLKILLVPFDAAGAANHQPAGD